MKITLERLREIVTEEVIKESVSPEDAQRTIVALLQDTPQEVTGDIMGAVYDEMYESDVAEPEEEEMRRAIRSPGQKEAEKVPVDAPEQKTIGGLHRGIEEIIRQEYYIYLIESHQRLLKEAPYVSPQASRQSAAAMARQTANQDAIKRAHRNIAMRDPKLTPRWSSVGPLKNPKTGERMAAEEWAKLILSMGEPKRNDPEFQSSIYFSDPESESGYSRKPNPEYIETRPYDIAYDDYQFAKDLKKAGFPPAPEEFHGAKDPTQLGHPAVSLPRTMTQWNKTSLNDLVNIWDEYIKGGGNIRKAVEKTQIEGEKITDALAAFYKKLTADANIQQHTR